MIRRFVFSWAVSWFFSAITFPALGGQHSSGAVAGGGGRSNAAPARSGNTNATQHRGGVAAKPNGHQSAIATQPVSRQGSRFGFSGRSVAAGSLPRTNTPATTATTNQTVVNNYYGGGYG